MDKDKEGDLPGEQWKDQIDAALALEVFTIEVARDVHTILSL